MHKAWVVSVHFSYHRPRMSPISIFLLIAESLHHVICTLTRGSKWPPPCCSQAFKLSSLKSLCLCHLCRSDSIIHPNPCPPFIVSSIMSVPSTISSASSSNPLHSHHQLLPDPLIALSRVLRKTLIRCMLGRSFEAGALQYHNLVSTSQITPHTTQSPLITLTILLPSPSTTKHIPDKANTPYPPP